jgi:putative phosphonate metabolism protein
MAPFPRYAIYHAAARGGALDRFGAHLLGYDAWSGEDLAFPDSISQAVPDWRDLTHDPRKYGFHATLKPPMALADRKTEAEVLAACKSFAETPRPIPVIIPVVDSISGFIAVVPSKPSAELEQFAADCISAFEPFRAPLTAEERARRHPSKLTSRQREYLDRFGYPYVMEEFRFHMTLTGRLGSERGASVLTVLRQCFAAIKLERLAVDGIALFRQNDAASRFKIIGHWPLRPSPEK